MQNVKANNFMAMNTENRAAAASFIRASYASVSFETLIVIGKPNKKGISLNRRQFGPTFRSKLLNKPECSSIWWYYQSRGYFNIDSPLKRSKL